MKQRTNVVLLATLVSAAAWGQEVSVFGTTMAEVWKQNAPGFDKTSYTPATQYLGIDATQLGSGGLSLHLYGWGRTDPGWTTSGGRNGGDLTYGYLKYRLPEANAELKAGRFAISQGSGVEQVDGVSARADLRGGFTLSVFGGKPVVYNTLDQAAQKEYELQHNFIVGGRLGLRVPKVGEVGVSYLQDGTKEAKGLLGPATVDYTRKQLAGDLRISPISSVDFYGRTVFDMAKHDNTPAGQAEPPKIAEHDYNLGLKFGSKFALKGSFVERNFQPFYAGTNFYSLFNPLEKDKLRATGVSLSHTPMDALEVIVDYRHSDRQTYGGSNRVGGEVRWAKREQKVQAGVGFHRVTAKEVAFNVVVDPRYPSFSLSHREGRAWVMYDGGLLTASLDGIYQRFDDSMNPHLNGQQSIYEAVASVGIRANANLKFSGDVSYGANPVFKKETRALLRAEFRFGLAGKGGK